MLSTRESGCASGTDHFRTWILKFSTCFFTVFRTYWNFNMLFYSFQNMLKISTCFFIDKMIKKKKKINDTNSCKGTYSSLLSIWLRVCKIRTQQIITIVLKTILKISRHAENHVKHFKECWNIVFKMHYGFQHVLKFSFQHALQISEHSEISRHAENHVKRFKECWNIVFKMHYGFQHVLKFSFQHALQISEHSEIFKMLF